MLLLPMAATITVEDLLDWGRFSVVSSTYAVSAPQFHRVVPHQFSNVRRAFAELVALGYERVGLVQRRRHSSMVNHSFLGAITTENYPRPAQAVTPFVFGEDFPEGIKAWFEREQPDALLVEGGSTYACLERELDLSSTRTGVALTNRERSSALAGMDEHGAAIGRTAIDVLAYKIQTGDKGIPKQPTVTMIEGNWIPKALGRKPVPTPRPA